MGCPLNPQSLQTSGSHIHSRSEGATLVHQAFALTYPFPLQNCFAHSLDLSPERGKDDCASNILTEPFTPTPCSSHPPVELAGSCF